MGEAGEAEVGVRWPSGPWASVDVGTVRVGVAATDPERRIAFPVETVPRDRNTMERIGAIVEERGVVAVFVGLPLTLAGREGSSALSARSFAKELVQHLAVPVRLIDERLSTSSARAALREAGWSARRQKAVIDQAAAVVILELVLDGRNNGILDNLTEQVAQGE
ncbi:MAG: Holliday junction resolvase RuvX [Demequinaceae bacterium]|nr:Holliday junction resolvase RuvX [Demequinaceae bacterium]